MSEVRGTSARYAASLKPLWDPDDKPGGNHYRRDLERGLPRTDMYSAAFRKQALAARRKRIQAERLAHEARIAEARLEAQAQELEAFLAAQDNKPSPAPAMDTGAGDARLSDAPRDPCAVRDIQRRVAQAHGMTLGVLLGPSRRRPVIAARDAAIAAVHHAKPQLSLPQIGRAFADRDHTTILHSLRKTGAYLGADRASRDVSEAAVVPAEGGAHV